MNIAAQKKNLLSWLSTIEDPIVLNQIEKIKTQKEFDFDKEFEKGITGDELKKRTTKFIKTLPWKK